MTDRAPRGPITLLLLAVLAVTSTAVEAQFDDVPVPEAMSALDFMLGDWQVEGTFRMPDHVGQDRTLWYLTRVDGITRFDGQAWVAFRPGESPVADSILQLVTARAEPFAFTNPLTATRIQDGFALLLDQGRTAGTILIYFDTDEAAWVATGFHAPTIAVTTSVAAATEGLPVFEGRETDRRGERIFRQRYELHGPDAYTIRTDVSFDEGVTWMDDQMIRQVRRR